MSASVQPHRPQPTGLPRPWDPPGKNTGVGCHFLHQCLKVKSEREVSQSCPTLSDPMDCSLPGSSIHGIFQARVLEWGAIAFSNHRLPRSSENAGSLNWDHESDETIYREGLWEQEDTVCYWWQCKLHTAWYLLNII